MPNASLDPVSPDDLSRLAELDKTKTALALRLLDLENDKIRIMAASRRIEDEWGGLFRRFVEERGLDPQTRIEVNYKTGAVSVQTVEGPSPPPNEEAPKEA